MCQESGGILLLHEQPVQGRGGFNATSFQLSMPHPLPKMGISAQIVEDFVNSWLNLVGWIHRTRDLFFVSGFVSLSK